MGLVTGFLGQWMGGFVFAPVLLPLWAGGYAAMKGIGRWERHQANMVLLNERPEPRRVSI